MTERLNEKVAELHDLRTQNEVMERKLMTILNLFSAGQEGVVSIINGSALPGGADHAPHEEATPADAREQDHAAGMVPAALREPVVAAAVAGEAIDDATPRNQLQTQLTPTASTRAPDPPRAQMSAGSHPAAEPEPLVVEPDDNGDGEFDLEAVLERAVEAVRQKAMQLGQAAETMRTKYHEDTINLDGCVATDLRRHKHESAASTPAVACPRRLITQERERLELNSAKMQRAKSLPLRELVALTGWRRIRKVLPALL